MVIRISGSSGAGGYHHFGDALEVCPVCESLGIQSYPGPRDGLAYGVHCLSLARYSASANRERNAQGNMWGFFLVQPYSHVAYLGYGGALFYLGFPSAVREAHCNLPLAFRPGLSQEDMKRSKEITEERKESGRKKEQRKKYSVP